MVAGMSMEYRRLGGVSAPLQETEHVLHRADDMNPLRRTRTPRTFPSLLLGLGLGLGAAACGSGSTGDLSSYAHAGPAAVDPTYGSDGGGNGSSGGGSSSGSGGNADGGSSDGGVGGFGNESTTSFTLINATITTVPAGAPVEGYDPIKFDATIDLAVVGRKLSIRANPPAVSQIGSMAFALDASYTHTANTSPYSLCGDDGKGNFIPCDIPVGKHTLTVTPYPLTKLGGTPYQPTVFEFTIADSSLDAGTD
jgi:hypothetical protein